MKIIPWHAKDEELYFLSTRLVKDPRTERPKGFGFVTYESEAEAQKALKAMNGRKLMVFIVHSLAEDDAYEDQWSIEILKKLKHIVKLPSPN
ncbi:hypothetical protein FH972_011456 [Carpinus fangiana]|uniref:RRM domain-containing protein n=1 Tax=Carpinus fangiana TaxID=176857 RepID=A0A660KRD8_9ROSI|nr:hypothetical protein FH972_011456 [Carpinus fangiana]